MPDDEVIKTRRRSGRAPSDRGDLKSLVYHRRPTRLPTPPPSTMRPLTEDESKAVFTKLSNFIGKNLISLIDRKDEPYCFRLHKDRVFYVPESSMKLAVSVARPNLVSLGTCFGKFSKGGTFKLHVTALDHLAQYAKYKVWIKPNGEMPFLYGNHVLKAHLGRITEDTPEHQGVVVYSMSDVPLGFGVTARSTVDTRKLDPTAIIVFHQSDVGEYLRDEETLF
ncbi:Pre-PUA domain-containing protein [Schizophyllum commune Loenen D]|nr:Pre-PUA domain-containing protein [Schizophyllum commune Loenen D]